MIELESIREWGKVHSWPYPFQIEQDLILSRIIVETFNNPELADRLAMRGGTALHKVHLPEQKRYSVDIDLVQINPEKIMWTFDCLQESLAFLGKPSWKKKKNRFVMNYKFKSSDTPPADKKVKIEINTREHFSELGFVKLPFKMENSWFTGETMVNTYKSDEILATKLRALYQRKKARDLYDVWWSHKLGIIDVDTVIQCFNRYMSEEKNKVTRAQFDANITEKAEDSDFRNDVTLVIPVDAEWDFDLAVKDVRENIIARIPE